MIINEKNHYMFNRGSVREATGSIFIPSNENNFQLSNFHLELACLDNIIHKLSLLQCNCATADVENAFSKPTLMS